LASAELHLSPQFASMQAELRERMQFARRALAEHGLCMATDAETPIFMMHYDSAPAATAVVSALRERGFYCCVSTFPAVPLNKPSLRFTVSRHNSFEDLEAFIQNLAEVTRDVSGASATRNKPDTLTAASPNAI
jgi:7-keto-8-aminopelargonate synthetase-like enzyme